MEPRLDLPTLKAVILDFSSVNNVDITSIQILIDVRNQLDRWAAPDTVEWHFAHITNRWTKRALVNAGFGYPTPPGPEFRRWKPIFSVAEIGGSTSAAAVAEKQANKRGRSMQYNNDNGNLLPVVTGASHGSGVSTTNPTTTIPSHDLVGADTSSTGQNDSQVEVEKGLSKVKSRSLPNGGGGGGGKAAVVHSINRPLFHIDLTSALQAAISNAEWKVAESGKDIS